MTKYNTEPFAIEYHNARLSGFKAEKVAKNRIVFAGCSMIEFGHWQRPIKQLYHSKQRNIGRQFIWSAKSH